MKKINRFLLSSLLCFTTSLAANDLDCSSSIYSLTEALPEVKLPSIGLGLDVPVTTQFCFDIKKNKEMLIDFEELKSLKVFDESNCAYPDEVAFEHKNKLMLFMLKVMEKSPMNVYSLTPKGVSDENYSPKKLLFTNMGEDGQKLTVKDTLKIAGVTAGSIFIGTLASREIYKGDAYADKRKHEMSGAVISVAGTGLGYLAIETFGIGDRLKLSKRSRKCAITATGGLMLLLAAAGKEAYDKTKPTKHTVDKHDFFSTSLGGGAAAPFMISCGIDF